MKLPCYLKGCREPRLRRTLYCQRHTDEITLGAKPVYGIHRRKPVAVGLLPPATDVLDEQILQFPDVARRLGYMVGVRQDLARRKAEAADQ